MSSTYLADWYDPALNTTDKTDGRLEAAYFGLSARDLAVARCALATPRRLGGDAGSVDLARDKRRARRVVYVIEKSLLAWGGKIDAGKPTADERRRAAQLTWRTFVETRISFLQNHGRICASYAINSGLEDWGKTILTHIRNEIGWLQYALRD